MINYRTNKEIISTIRVGSLHEITLRSGMKVSCYIDRVRNHGDYTDSFFGWNHSKDTFFSTGEPVKCGLYYWINSRDWKGVVDIKPLSRTSK